MIKLSMYRRGYSTIEYKLKAKNEIIFLMLKSSCLINSSGERFINIFVWQVVRSDIFPWFWLAEKHCYYGNCRIKQDLSDKMSDKFFHETLPWCIQKLNFPGLG